LLVAGITQQLKTSGGEADLATISKLNKNDAP